MRITLISLAAAAALTAGGALAQDLNDPEEQLTARHGYMLMLAMNTATLGAMAKGDIAYDAVTAKAAAENIASLATVDSTFLWKDGTDSEKLQDSSALPTAFTDVAGRAEKTDALKAAAAAMVTAAGTDLAALKTGMEALGGACAACHKAYRKPE